MDPQLNFSLGQGAAAYQNRRKPISLATGPDLTMSENDGSREDLLETPRDDSTINHLWNTLRAVLYSKKWDFKALEAVADPWIFRYKWCL